MRIKLRFIGTGINDFYQARVKIYDKNHNLLKDGYTYNGLIYFTAHNKEIYIIKVNFINIIINIPLYINNKCKYEFYLSNNRKTEFNLITFLLTDSNYLNLPIKKGEIIYG